MGWIVAGGVTSALFFFSSIYVPLVGSFLGILAPIPIIILFLRRGWKGGLYSSLVAVLFVGFTLKPIVAVYFFVQFVMLGLVAAYLIKNRASFGVIMLVSSLAVAVGFFLLIGIQAFHSHQGFFDALKKPLQENVHAVLKSYPGLSGTEAEDASKMFQKMLSILIVLIPSLIVIGSWVILLVNFYLIDRLHLLPGRGLLKTFDLNIWKAPEHLIWFVIVPGFAVFLLHGSLRIIALNIMIATLTIYFFQGFCVVNFFFARKGVPPLVKMLIYFVLFVIQIVAVMVAVIGLLDMWMDFRKLSKGHETPTTSNEGPSGEDE